MGKSKLSQNNKLFQEARNYLVGGVSSPVRSFKYVGGQPILIRNGRGANIYDYDGNEYIDYVLSWGAVILGHAYPRVIKDLKEAIEAGLGFGATNRQEVELAKCIQDAIPVIEKIRFVNSGTEAVMGAVRLARGYTGRDKIIKFVNSYHGHADYLLTKAGSGLATLGIPASKGVPKDFTKHTLVLPFADKKAIGQAFKKYGKEIAAVLIEPVGGNSGVLPPDIDFLTHLRKLTQKYRTLLIFDEVITGFRFHYGSIAQKLGIKPDLICLGKIIGGALPVGAYGGRQEIMRYLAPLGGVYQASTFAGNPIVMQAGLTTLKILEKSGDNYVRAKQLTEYLVSRLEQEAIRHNIDLEVSYYETMFSLKFKDKAKFRRFYKFIIKEGIYLAPSEFEANFLSFAHSKIDIEKTLESVKRAFNRRGIDGRRKY